MYEDFSDSKYRLCFSFSRDLEEFGKYSHVNNLVLFFKSPPFQFIRLYRKILPSKNQNRKRFGLVVYFLVCNMSIFSFHLSSSQCQHCSVESAEQFSNLVQRRQFVSEPKFQGTLKLFFFLMFKIRIEFKVSLSDA